VFALVVGILIGLLPIAGATFGPFVAVLSMVPPLALLPILFIVMGLGEASKITLIVVGTTLKLIRDIALRVGDIPREQLIKAQTLGASTAQIASRIVLPQILPRLIDSVRLEIGPAWLFLIAAEAIAADSGLGYRIFLVRRYLSMDVILPYVVWITLLAFLMDLSLRLLQRRAYPWFAQARAA
jgi:NitT/TauT family transport system permease protein